MKTATIDMKLNLSCTDFSFPLLPHDAALKVIALLGCRGADIGLFAGRSHLRPENELRRRAAAPASLARLPDVDAIVQAVLEKMKK